MDNEPIKKKLFASKRKYLTGGVAVIVVLAVLIFFKSGKNGALNIITVARGSVKQEVLVTGTVKPSDSVELAFEKSGKVAWVGKNVGDSVYAGETIVVLDNGTEEAALSSAEADLKSAEAHYQELKLGNRPEDINVSEAALDKAKQDLANDYGSVDDTISDGYDKSDNAVNVQTDPIFSNDQSANPNLTFIVNNQQIKNDVIAARILITETLKSFKTLTDSLLSASRTNEKNDTMLEEARADLIQVQNFLIKVSATLDASANLSDTTLAAYKNSIATGRTNVNTALKAINDLIETIASQKITVEKTDRELTLKKLGATPEVLAQAQASIDQASASVKSAEAALRKTIIHSPIDGIVTKQDAKVGEIAAANEPLVSVMGRKSFKIEAYIPEVDSTKLSVGGKAEVTLDAYGNDVIFGASVVSIDPAEHVIDGVSTYKTTFTFTNEPKPIKSGMTANVTVKTDEKQNVLVVPQRAVTSKNGGKYVNIVTNGKTLIEKEVQTGLKGSDGMIEIVSGLSEGEKVVNYTK
jgi:HlyD family secretion protein